MDFLIADHGSIFLLTPVSPAAREWVREHLPADASTFGRSFAIEHRYIEDIVGDLLVYGFDIA